MNARLNKENVLLTAQRILGLAGLASLALACAGPAWAQSQPSPTESTPAHPAVTAPATSPGVPSSSVAPGPKQGLTQSSQAGPSVPRGQHEGIAVHGHWIIDVKNPDGTLASHREFENAIASTGPDLLTGLLSGQYTSGGFYVILRGAMGNPGGCISSVDVCYLIDTRASGGCIFGGFFNVAPCGALTYTPNPQTIGLLAAGYTLTGTVQLPSGPNPFLIISVSSGVNFCFNQYAIVKPFSFLPTSPQVCGAPNLTNGNANGVNPSDLTGTSIATLTVNPGQTVSVTVVITFSS